MGVKVLSCEKVRLVEREATGLWLSDIDGDWVRVEEVLWRRLEVGVSEVDAVKELELVSDLDMVYVPNDIDSCKDAVGVTGKCRVEE